MNNRGGQVMKKRIILIALVAILVVTLGDAILINLVSGVTYFSWNNVKLENPNYVYYATGGYTLTSSDRATTAEDAISIAKSHRIANYHSFSVAYDPFANVWEVTLEDPPPRSHYSVAWSECQKVYVHRDGRVLLETYN